MEKPSKKPSKKLIKPGRTSQEKIGESVARLRAEQGWTQRELAHKINSSQPAVNRIEKGAKKLTVAQVDKLSQALGRQLISVNDTGVQNYRIRGGAELHGEVTINTSKNAAVALLCAALLNQGVTVFQNIARIE